MGQNAAVERELFNLLKSMMMGLRNNDNLLIPGSICPSVDPGSCPSSRIEWNVRFIFILFAFMFEHDSVSLWEQDCFSGAVVFVSSVAAYAPIQGLGAYSVMKAALLGINKALSQVLISNFLINRSNYQLSLDTFLYIFHYLISIVYFLLTNR